MLHMMGVPATDIYGDCADASVHLTSLRVSTTRKKLISFRDTGIGDWGSEIGDWGSEIGGKVPQGTHRPKLDRTQKYAFNTLSV